MAGHLGDERVTVKDLEVVATDPENNIVIVFGSVPGAKGGYVYLTDAKKFARHPEAPDPAGLKSLVNKAAEVKEEVSEVSAEEALGAEQEKEEPKKSDSAESVKKSDDKKED